MTWQGGAVTWQGARRLLARGPIRFVLLLALFLPPWPATGRMYGGFVGALADGVLSDELSPVRFRFGPAPGAKLDPGPWHLRVRADDGETGRFIETSLDLRRSGYVASAMFAALVLATPLGWTWRLAALAGGLALWQLLPLVALLSFFSGKLAVQAFDLAAPVRWFVEIAYRALVAAPGMAYGAPLLLWLALVTRPPALMTTFPVWLGEHRAPGP